MAQANPLIRCLFRCLSALAFTSQLCLADETLTIGTWGGPYESAQNISLFQPFTKSTGIKIQKTSYSGGLEYVKMLLTEAGDDFIDGAITDCAVAHTTFSTLVAFDERAFPDEKPSRIKDFFDTKKFPGKRAVQKNPAALFEWALMAEGIPLSQIYDLLSTERGMRLALKRMDSVREHLVWWETPQESVDLLTNQVVVMASGYNGRFFDARSRNQPINLIWDGQIIDRSVWAMPVRQSSSLPNALAFIRFATHERRMGELAEFIPYGPTRHSAFDFIGRHPEYGMNMIPQLPTAPRHIKTSLIRDTRWYARTTEFRHSNFDQWLFRIKR